ncbi:hypothetical protein BC830DRAFT_384335 [Chytriomyces sp. MP71]|nr:hypothetical protein BC830DRAFT_384335 [Chytriomyces sp. MP71]
MIVAMNRAELLNTSLVCIALSASSTICLVVFILWFDGTQHRWSIFNSQLLAMSTVSIALFATTYIEIDSDSLELAYQMAWAVGAALSGLWVIAFSRHSWKRSQQVIRQRYKKKEKIFRRIIEYLPYLAVLQALPSIMQATLNDVDPSLPALYQRLIYIAAIALPLLTLIVMLVLDGFFLLVFIQHISTFSQELSVEKRDSSFNLVARFGIAACVINITGVFILGISFMFSVEDWVGWLLSLVSNGCVHAAFLCLFGLKVALYLEKEKEMKLGNDLRLASALHSVKGDEIRVSSASGQVETRKG